LGFLITLSIFVNSKMIVSEEFQRMWKIPSMAYFKAPLIICQ
jgi:hypothetical protein